jgi:uncharacterized protein YbjQ (UPF0145 family)
MLVVTSPHVPGRGIVATLGMVSGEAILGANIFKDFFVGMLMVSASGTAVRLR